jgi:hypothetical protein
VSSAALNAHAGLLPSLLNGVSRRMEHPTEAMRLDGMHLGNAVARALDPTREALFEGVGSARSYAHSESEDEGHDERGRAAQRQSSPLQKEATTRSPADDARSCCSSQPLGAAAVTTGFHVGDSGGGAESKSSAPGALEEEGADDPDAEIEYVHTTPQHCGEDSGSDYDGRASDGDASADSDDDSLSPFEMSDEEEESSAAQILRERAGSLPPGEQSVVPRQVGDGLGPHSTHSSPDVYTAFALPSSGS